MLWTENARYLRIDDDIISRFDICKHDRTIENAGETNLKPIKSIQTVAVHIGWLLVDNLNVPVRYDKLFPSGKRHGSKV